MNVRLSSETASIKGASVVANSNVNKIYFETLISVCYVKISRTLAGIRLLRASGVGADSSCAACFSNESARDNRKISCTTGVTRKDATRDRSLIRYFQSLINGLDGNCCVVGIGADGGGPCLRCVQYETFDVASIFTGHANDNRASVIGIEK